MCADQCVSIASAHPFGMRDDSNGVMGAWESAVQHKTQVRNTASHLVCVVELLPARTNTVINLVGRNYVLTRKYSVNGELAPPEEMNRVLAVHPVCSRRRLEPTQCFFLAEAKCGG